MRGIVLSLPGVPPDTEQIGAHLQGIAQHFHPALRVEIPGNRHLVNDISEQAGDEKHLNIERPAGDRLPGKQLFSGFGGETFKTALRVVQPGSAAQRTRVLNARPTICR